MRLELEAGLRVDVFWPGTGPIVPEERLLLKQLLNGSMSQFLSGADSVYPFGSGGGLTADEFVADDSTDPCLHRLEESVCIGGHIVQLGNYGAFNHQRLPCDAFSILVQFSKLTQLHSFGTSTIESFAFRCAPGERVVVPCSFWELKDMVRMFWDFEPRGDGGEKFGATTRYHFEECAEGIGAMPKLLEFYGWFPDATGVLPAGLFQSPNMVKFRAEDIQLGNLPSLEFMPNLERMTLIDNNISGPFPSFANKARLKEVTIQGSPLQIPADAGGTTSFFDNCTELSSVALTDTYISDLFRFVGSTEIVSIDLSHNQINTTSFPESWSQLAKVKSLDLSHNAIQRVNTNPNDAGYNYDAPSPLRGMSSMLIVDLSHNEIADEIPINDGMSRFLKNMFGAYDPKSVIQHIDLSHNKIWSTDAGSQLVKAFSGDGLRLNSFSFHHNRLNGVFAVYDFDSCKYNFDGSYNRMNGITMGNNAGCTGKYLSSMRMDMSNQVGNFDAPYSTCIWLMCLCHYAHPRVHRFLVSRAS
jgi:hypothetical protein